jgi:curved DNA-binding protein CbpA
MDSRRGEAFGVLGIPADSDQNAVVHAYRRLARATHPDVSDDPDAADRFATVAAAYQLVSKDPRTTSIPVRIHEPAPGDQGWARASVRVGEGSTPGRPVHRGWATPMSAILGGRRDQRAPIVAGPAWIDPPRRRVDTEVRGG